MKTLKKVREDHNHSILSMISSNFVDGLQSNMDKALLYNNQDTWDTYWFIKAHILKKRLK